MCLLLRRRDHIWLPPSVARIFCGKIAAVLETSQAPGLPRYDFRPDKLAVSIFKLNTSRKVNSLHSGSLEKQGSKSHTVQMI